MAKKAVYNINKTFPIYKADGTSFYGLEIRKATVESVVMSLGDKISGDVYYPNNALQFTMQEYVVLDGVCYYLVNPPTIVREGLVKDNSGLNGMTKYSLVFYHPMYMLGNFPFTDKAVTNDEENYLAQNNTFSWIGNLFDFAEKLNVNLEYTDWLVFANIEQENEAQYQKANKLSDVLTFDKQFISDALKTAFDTWEIPFTITSIDRDVEVEGQLVHKSFLIEFGLPSQEILGTNGQPFVFKFGQGVGLKNNSRTPKNNKIVTRIVGTGSEQNIPFGYPQIRWWGDQRWDFTEYEGSEIHYDESGKVTNNPTPTAYPIYKGILGGQYVKLIKHTFTRKTLMPSVYVDCVFNKVSPYLERTLPNGEIVPNPNYNRQGQIIDYYDAVDTQETQYPNPINTNAPSVEIHQFEDVYPRLGEANIVTAYPINTSNTSGKIIVTPLISSFITNVLAPAQLASPNQNEKDAIQGLIDFLTLVDGGGVVIPYYDSNTGGSYTYSIVVQPKGTGYQGIWVVNYTSDNFKVENQELCEQSLAPTWDDTMDDNGKYVQTYFKIQLPILDYDLYACASITENMQINMRDGACIGCTFNVMVDWEDYKKNFYDEEGNFAPDGEQRNRLKYPDSSEVSIELICQKDLDTFGTLMPNKYQYPSANDQFVILGISLPTSYITNAQEELDETMKEYMLENNIHYFDYPLKFDEYFLTTHQDILAQIKNNNIVRFQYIGTNMALYIKQIIVKYGEGVLPTWDITLTDDVEIVLSKIGQVTDDVSRMRVQLSELQKYYNENIITLIEGKLSKVSDDVAQGRITFQQGLDAIGSILLSNEIKSNDFASGLGGRGWRIDHMGNAEVESLKVRSYLEVIELLINRLQAQEGDTLFTDNDQIDKVDVYEDDGATTYILSLKEKYEGYFTSQMYGNILKGIINTLAAKEAGVSDYEWAVAPYSSSVNPMEEGYYERSGEEGSYVYTPTSDTAMSPAKTYYYHPTVESDGSNSYYTSWMQVVGTNVTEPSICGKNQIRVVLYSDDQTPAEKNFVPCELMAIARWGCWLNPDEPDISVAEQESRRRRQQLFYLSTKEGRIVKLTGVNTPKIEDFNYGTTLGTYPNFIKSWAISDRLTEGRDYLYAQGIIVGDFIKVDIQGQPLINYVDCGEWYDGGAQGAVPTIGHGIYLCNEKNDINLQWETHDVWHNGFRWRCNMHQPVTSGSTTTYYEPKWGSPYWTPIEGDGSLTMEFVSSNGYSFRRGYVDTHIYTHIFYGGIDITDESYGSNPKIEFLGWTRCSEANWNDGSPIFTPDDIAWNAQHIHGYQGFDARDLHLTSQDLPSDWAVNNKYIFRCMANVNDGQNYTIIDNIIVS